MLVIFFVPLWIVSLDTFLKGGQFTNRDTSHLVSTLVHELAALGLLAYILKRSNRGWSELGFRFSLSGIGSGLVLWLTTRVLSYVAYYLFQYSHWMLFHSWAKPWNLSAMMGSSSVWVLVPFLFTNPWFEEGIVRGYFMTELRDLTGSSWIAIVATTLLQTGYHLYQGVVNATIVGTCFLIFSVYYARSRKLFPVIVAHTIMDVIAGIALVARAFPH